MIRNMKFICRVDKDISCNRSLCAPVRYPGQQSKLISWRTSCIMPTSVISKLLFYYLCNVKKCIFNFDVSKYSISSFYKCCMSVKHKSLLNILRIFLCVWRKIRQSKQNAENPLKN